MIHACKGSLGGVAHTAGAGADEEVRIDEGATFLDGQCGQVTRFQISRNASLQQAKTLRIANSPQRWIHADEPDIVRETAIAKEVAMLDLLSARERSVGSR